MASKRIADIATINGQVITVAADAYGGVVRIAKDGHNRAIAKLDATSLTALIDAATIALGMVSA